MSQKVPAGRIKRICLITAAAFAAATLLYLCGAFTFLENKSYDYRVRLFAGMSRPSEEIFVVVLDQASLDWAQKERGWSWPWPRSAYAEMTRFFAEGGAYSLTFDVLFTEPSLYGPQDDGDFANACAEFGGAVQTVFFSNQYGNAAQWPQNLRQPRFSAGNFAAGEFAAAKPAFYSPEKALFPVRVIAESAAALGNITGISDSDAVIRRNRLFYTFDGLVVPGLAVAALTARRNEPQNFVFDSAKKTVSFEGKTFPTAKDGSVLLRFRSSIDAYIPYSAADILQSREDSLAGKTSLLDSKMFADKYVFFCFYAPGLFDICATPISNTYPGAGVHITTLDNFLQNDFLSPAPFAAVLALLLAAALFGAAFQHVSVAASAICVPAGTSLLAVLCGAAYILGLNLPFVAPFFALAASFTAALIVSYNTESRQKRYIKAVFRQYLSPAVIERLIAHPEQVKLGGELREISIFFSDVQGFTGISERLSPEALTELLNDYLSAMSDIILESGGTIDKYEGDAIIAFWNAPLTQNDHARRALEAAVGCQTKLAEMADSLTRRAGTPLLMRIGLNTGKAVVGNMGSRSRFDYTMLGDSVNLAARLEGLNKQFGTYTMCTDAARQTALEYGTPLRFRELSRVAVVGKKEAVTVYEPMTAQHYEAKAGELAVFAQGLSLFYQGNFTEGLAAFESIRHCDKPAEMYAAKCRELISSPPQNWNGVWQAASK